MLNTTEVNTSAVALPLGPNIKPGKFWKVLQFPLTRAIILGLVAMIALIAAQVLREIGASQSAAVAGLLILLSIVLIVGLYVLFIRLIERRRASEFAPSFAVRELALGALIGFLAISLTVALMWLVGTYRVVGINANVALLTALAIGLLPAFGEEVFFRGVLYRIIEDSFGTWAALLSVSLLFGLSHLANPNASWFAAIAIAIEAGLMLGATYTLTQRLWLSIGIHFAWNWAQGGLYGVPVSGINVDGILSAVVQGPALLSGDGFGAEATVLAIAVCLVIFVLSMRAIYRNGMLILPVWQRRRLLKNQAQSLETSAANLRD